MINFSIDKSWKNKLNQEFQKSYYSNLLSFLKSEYSSYSIYPSRSLIFDAFNKCPFTDVKVVIIGQDPYHGDGQAHGLSFSVPDGINHPPSLKNIFKEIYLDLAIDPPESGNLNRWAIQGVLLLNSILTVRKGSPGSHHMKGWEEFTDSVIEILSGEKNNLVFMLWGAYAFKKGLKINRDKHLVMETSHPSPFSAHKGFLKSKQFSMCNDYLKFHKKAIINW